jgi:L-aminopeptidase/D-esterase-like protein
MNNLITDVGGIVVGHATDLVLGSGSTAVLFDQPTVVAVTIRGGAPGGRDTAMLEPEMTRQTVDGVVLSGGSIFGLDAASGAQAWLREQGRGFRLRGALVPLVPGAIVFDLLNGGDKGWGRFSPYRELGYQAAAAAAHGAFTLGTVGAGTGATTATVKGGLGSASAVTASGHRVGAIVAVNAVGSATIGDGPHFWASPWEVGGEFGGLGMPAHPDAGLRMKGAPAPPSTTIALVATDATLTKAQAKRLAIMADDGLARAVHPAHAPGDGDTVFAASLGSAPAPVDDGALTALGHAAACVLARAIGRGVFEATALPYPGALADWRGRFGSVLPR